MASKTRWEEFNRQMADRVKWREVAEEILGIQFAGSREGTSGWIKCHSVDGADANPSAGFNVQSGFYRDFRDGEPAVSAYDLMIQLGKATDFVDARKQIASKFGVKWPGTEENSPESGVKWQKWNDTLAIAYCDMKNPITIEGLKRAGARMCIRYKDPCFALPVHNLESQIVGWMFFPRNGKPFEQEAANGAKSICKIQDGMDAGLVCGPTTADALVDGYEKTVIWCEGAPDMLAILSAYPEALVFTNPHGCQERVSEVQRLMITRHSHKCFVIGDADKPGVEGAIKRSMAVHGTPLVAPYDIVDKHGKDVRDWLGGDNAISSLVEDMLGAMNSPPKETVEKVKPWTAESKQEPTIDEDDQRDMWNKTIEKSTIVLHKVGLHILANDPSGQLSLYSSYTNVVKQIPDISHAYYNNWVQFLGAPFASYVVATAKEWEILNTPATPCITFATFQKHLALASTKSEIIDSEQVGAGIWPVIDKDCAPTGEIMCVKRGMVVKYSNGNIVKERQPIIGKNICDIGTRINWFDPDELATNVASALSEDWRQEVYNEIFKILNQWRWANRDMTQLVIGLTMATMIQSLLKWRPIVTVSGESNSGKSVLFRVISGLFCGLSQLSSQSTVAGILQNMGRDSRALMLDEFDTTKEQEKLFKMFRISGRGQEKLMGTSGHSGTSYCVRHLPWLSGIHTASDDQADQNRIIDIRTLKAKDNATTIEEPAVDKLHAIGKKIIAGMIVCANQACEYSARLSKSDGGSISSRYRESYSVPFGCLGAFLGLDLESTQAIMDDYLSKNVAPAIEVEDATTDQESLLLDILQSEVKMPYDGPESVASVAEILFDNRFEMHRDAARTKGVGFVVCKKGPSRYKVAFVGKKIASADGVLHKTKWAGIAGTSQILERLPLDLRPTKEKQVVAGLLMSCVSVDYDALKRWAVSNTGRNFKDTVPK